MLLKQDPVAIQASTIKKNLKKKFNWEQSYKENNKKWSIIGKISMRPKTDFLKKNQ